jgi:hypothetical protein
MRLKSKNKRKNIIVYSILILSLLLIAAIFLIFHSQKIIPTKYAKQISFIVYWPGDNESRPDKASIKYSSSTGVISYVDFVNTDKIVIDEQSTPSVFTDFSNYYSDLIAHLNNYDSISTNVGTVYLTLPKGVNTAISNNHGTLLFASSSQKLSENTWRSIFNGFTAIHS